MKRAKDSHVLKWVLLSAMVANAMVLIDQTAVPLALPDIVHTFGVGSGQSQWVLNASLLPLAGFLVFGGRLGDMLGCRRVFLAGLFIFAGASAVGGLAPTFPLLLLCRVLQGLGGALMLPNTIALVSLMVSNRNKGRALGMVGGAAAIAGAFGPTIGGILTSAFSWRAVLLVNLPLAFIAYMALRRASLPDKLPKTPGHIDIKGSTLLAMALVGLVFGLAQSLQAGWSDPTVVVPLVVSVASGAAFVIVERRSPMPLMNFGLLRRHPNYLGATLSQVIGGMAEMGLGFILPLFLILNLGMPPVVAGLALIPSSLPMIFVAPLAGRWYDRVGGRTPLLAGFALLALSGAALAAGVFADAYLWIFPGLLLYGIGLALVLTTNDPVTLDTLPPDKHGQASGVSATAEQFGGALGIAGLYLIFHVNYVDRLHELIAHSTLAGTASQLANLKDTLIAAEQTGLRPDKISSSLLEYLLLARSASDYGYAIVFGIVGVLAVAGLLVVALMVRPVRASD